MRIKTGDIAIQIKSMAGNEGKIVKVLQPLGLISVDGLAEPVDAFMVDYGRPVLGYGPEFGIKGLPAVTPGITAYFRPVSGLPGTEDVNAESPIEEN